MEAQQTEATRAAIKQLQAEFNSHAESAAGEIRHLHARVQELEGMLEAVGAGGVSAQRITQAADHIEQPIEMVAAPAELNLDDYYCKGCGRIGEIEELSTQDKAKLRKLDGKPKTAAAPVEVPKVGSAWRHKNGNAYRVVAIANDCDAHFSERYPVTVVYQGENGKMWARRADDWHRSMTHDATAPSTAPVVLPEPLCWVNEDELPESMSQEAYAALFPYSKVDIVRLFPIFAAPQPQADALDAELLDWLEREVCDSYTGVTITRVDHREDGVVIERGFRLRRFHKDYEVKPTLRAAIAAAKENK